MAVGFVKPPKGNVAQGAKDAVPESDKTVAVAQYCLLYFSLLSGQSYLVDYYLQNMVPIVGALLLLICCMIPRFWYFRNMAYLAFVCFLSVMVGTYVGGVGLGVFLKLASSILLISSAATLDIDAFPRRMVRIVVIFAAISVLVYLARLAIPGFYYLLPLKSFESQGTYYNMGAYASVPYTTKGTLLFSVREGEIRNIGIFTEPGVYQGVLNGTLFYLLFLRSKLQIGLREVTVSCVLIFAALLTCGSTTGYVTFLVLLTCFMLSIEVDGGRSIKSRLVLLAVALLGVVIIDYILRGADSFLSANVIDKIFIGSSGSADLSEGNSGARLKSVIACCELLSRHPLGVGFDMVQAYKPADAVGAGLFVYTAALGLPFFAATIWWLLAPFSSGKLGMPAIIAFIVMFAYFTFSQVLIISPVIVSIPIYLSILNERKRSESSLAV